MSKKSISELAEADAQVELVELDLIDFDPENPNELPPAMYETLKSEIQLVGFNQPVLLWRQGERFRMIDGEHRARIVGELGGARIPAVITDAENEDEARLRLLTMNRLRGQFVPIRFAMLLADLNQRIPEAELRRRLGMEEAEFRDALSLANFTDDVGETVRAAVEKEAREAPVAMRFVVSARDAQLIERVIASLTEGPLDRGQALAKVCRHWETSGAKAGEREEPEQDA